VDAVGPEGITEVVHEEGHRFLLGVQFHPEFYCGKDDDDHSTAIFTAFVNACR
jgi:gamma-glutamyl-gamma-aminobutyrate hydrolase PuuD